MQGCESDTEEINRYKCDQSKLNFSLLLVNFFSQESQPSGASGIKASPIGVCRKAERSVNQFFLPVSGLGEENFLCKFVISVVFQILYT